MKNLLSTLIIALLLAACSTSTNNDNPSQIGTWHIDTQTHATWQGRTDKSTSILMATASENDTTAKPDTTYFYSNDKIQATLGKVSRKVYEGDMELDVNQNDFNGRSISDNYRRVKVVNLESAFKIIGDRGSLFAPDKMNMKIQLDFNCNAPRQDKNLELAFIDYQADSVQTPPDTLLYYNISTKGLYSTAAYLKGCN